MTGLLFPGHGSQRPQMLHDLVHHPAVDETLSEISAVLDLDVRTLDTAEALQSVVWVQLAILTAGAATARALQHTLYSWGTSTHQGRSSSLAQMRESKRFYRKPAY
jgi:malonyl CoA-acyl carrier protein transacylase